MKPCVVCETVLVPTEIWEEELGMCLECSNAYWTHEGEEE